MTRAPVKPELLRWARERRGVTQDDLKAKFKRLPEWESGQLRPTVKQLEEFAKSVHVPFGYLFLPEPPDERLPIADFRTIGNAKRAKPSPDLIDTLCTMQSRQAWLRERLIWNGAGPLEFAAGASLADDPGAVGIAMRRALGLSAGWAAKIQTWEHAVGELRLLIETLGVMAVMNGVVGNNTHRPLSVTEFRGFALPDNYAPLIFVNGADAKSAQMFTLAHELAHIWLGVAGLSGFENLIPEGTDAEVWCNQAAAEMLIPEQELRDCLMDVGRDPLDFKSLARAFKVSPVVAARRAMDLELIDRSTFLDFHDQFSSQERSGGRIGSGGDFYNNQNARVGKLFAIHVYRAAMEGQLGFKEAYELTGLRGASFQEYAKRLGAGV